MKRRSDGKKAESRNQPKEDGVTTILKRKLQPPTPEQIQKRAYQIFLARGGGPGRELGDWLQAEREIREQSQPVADEASRKPPVNR